MSELTKKCSDCAHLETRWDPIKEGTELREVCWCTYGKECGRSAHLTLRDESGCNDWYPAKFVGKAVTCQSGCKFPHCPTCNEDLEIMCEHCDENAAVGDPFEFNYCPWCGQKLDWTDVFPKKGEVNENA